MIKVMSFCELYDIEPDALHQCKHNGSLPSYIFKKSNNEVYVDKKYILKRYEFRRWVANRCHEFYYFFTRYFNTYTFALMLHKVNPEHSQSTWCSFMSVKLFQSQDYSVLNFRIRPLMWKFFRYCRWILIYIFKIKGLKYKNCDLNLVHYLGE